MFLPNSPEQPTAEEVTTYKVALRYQTLETLYQLYKRCLSGQRLASDFGTTIDELRVHARNYRLRQARGHLEHIEQCQNGYTTQELLETVEEYMREFNISFAEVDMTEGAFNELRARARPKPSPLAALHARVAEQKPYGVQPPRPR